MGDLTNEDFTFMRAKLALTERSGIYLTKREVRGLLDLAERCAKAEKAATTVEYHSFTGTERTYEDLLAKEKAAGELLRFAKDALAWLSDKRMGTWPYMEGSGFYDDAHRFIWEAGQAIETAERAGVKP